MKTLVTLITLFLLTLPSLAAEEMRPLDKDIPLADGIRRTNELFPDVQPLTEGEGIAAVRTAPVLPSLIFSGFSNQGQVAVFTLTNSSRFRKVQVWLALIEPNRLGDCQIKARTGEWLDCAVTTGSPNILTGTTVDGHWVHYWSGGVTTLNASIMRTVPPHGSLTVLMEVPQVGRSVRIGEVETNVAELHSPWRAGVRCLVSYNWPKVSENIFAWPPEHSFEYPREAFMVWSREVPR
jgi:hypothetical protein